MNEETEERLTVAFERIADALVRLATLSENRYVRDFPTKKAPQDVTLTRVPNEEDRLREDQGDTGETLEEWIGIREKTVIEEGKRRQSPRQGD